VEGQSNQYQTINRFQAAPEQSEPHLGRVAHAIHASNLEREIEVMLLLWSMESNLRSSPQQCTATLSNAGISIQAIVLEPHHQSCAISM
jgi:hypothetical protein